VGAVAADGAALSLDDKVGEAATVEDPAVGFVHRAVALVKLREVGVDAVGVLHQELTRPDDAEARSGLVAKLGLNLVKGQGQLLVRPYKVAHQVGDHLLVSRPEGHLMTPRQSQFHE